VDAGVHRLSAPDQKSAHKFQTKRTANDQRDCSRAESRGQPRIPRKRASDTEW